MLEDIVIDTNVLVHASDPRGTLRSHAMSFIEHLRDATTLLACDDGFTFEEASNRSLIGAEYLEQLRFGTPGYAIVAFLAAKGRVKSVPRKARAEHRRKLRSMISNQRDRTFVIVAMNAAECVLVSHDWEDFPEAIRVQVQSALSVHIVSSAEVMPMLE